MRRLRQMPYHRTMPDGSKLWEARVRFPDGSRHAFGLYKLKRDAQDAMDAEWESWHNTDPNPETVGGYSATWTERHPRSSRTNTTNDHRISRILDVVVEGRAFKDWMMRDLKRRQVYVLVDTMLSSQKRSVTGTRNILRALHAMFEDAITDECMDFNPVTGVKVRARDPRATKASRTPKVWTFKQMHTLAKHAGKYEPMCRVLSDCGLRLGELLALHRADLCGGCDECKGTHLHVQRNAHEGVVTMGDAATKRHVKIVPVPDSTHALLKAMPPRIDTPILFPTPTGCVWRESNFYRTVWFPARKDAGMPEARPHDFRHSYVSIMRAALGENHSADLAAIAGHSVETMTANYSHSLGQTFDKVRAVVG